MSHLRKSPVSPKLAQPKRGMIWSQVVRLAYPSRVVIREMQRRQLKAMQRGATLGQVIE